MVDRLIARWWDSLTMVAAKSSRVQRVAGRSCSSVLLVARLTTAVSSSGGKAPGSPRAGSILQASEASGDEAFTPQSDGMAITVEVGGDVLIARLIVLG